MLSTEYERTGLKHGITVQEWEEARGLPRYSVYPEAKLVEREGDVGFYMYPRAPPEGFARVFDNECVRQIRCFLALEVPRKVIVEVFNVSNPTISRIANGVDRFASI